MLSPVTREGLSGYLIRAIREDGDNNLLVITIKGIDQWRDGKFVPYDAGIEFVQHPGIKYADANNSTGFSFACALVRDRPLADLKERVLPIAGGSG